MVEMTDDFTDEGFLSNFCAAFSIGGLEIGVLGEIGYWGHHTLSPKCAVEFRDWITAQLEEFDELNL